MSTPEQPLKDPSGDHPPFSIYMLMCTANDGTTVTLSNDKVTVTYVFSDSDDAGYFVVGKSYAVLSFPAGQ